MKPWVALAVGCLWGAFAMATEIRGPVRSIEQTQSLLQKRGAKLQGTYCFHDTVYGEPPQPLNQNYWRLRHYSHTQWNQKAANVTHKKAPHPRKKPQKTLQKEFDTVVEAQATLPDSLQKEFSYQRKGWEYRLGKIRLFLEDIASLPPTLEVVADQPLTEVQALMKSLGVISFYDDPIPMIIWKRQKEKA